MQKPLMSTARWVLYITPIRMSLASQHTMACTGGKFRHEILLIVWRNYEAISKSSFEVVQRILPIPLNNH
jgi:hypothetical protein